MAGENSQFVNALKAQFGERTDLSHQLSYSNGVKNILGIGKSTNSIRVRVENKSKEDRIIYFMPIMTGGSKDATSDDTIYKRFDLPHGNLFFVDKIQTDDEDPVTLLEIKNMNPKQDLQVLAAMLNTSPIFISKAHMKSYSIAGAPESSNFGNEIRHYRLDYFKGVLVEDTPLFLTDGEKRSDNTTSVMTVDFIKKQFNAFVSTQDVLAFKVNAETKMDIDLTVAVQDSTPERFYRQVRAGVELLNNHFSTPGEDCSCK